MLLQNRDPITPLSQGVCCRTPSRSAPDDNDIFQGSDSSLVRGFVCFVAPDLLEKVKGKEIILRAVDLVTAPLSHLQAAISHVSASAFLRR